MKKVLLAILLVFLLVPVYAKDNRLYFTESEDRLYFESSLLDENIFMKHLNMVPGSKFTDTLKIQNGTSTTYTLFFKVVNVKQSTKAEELLKNITMRITLDGKVLYDGIATGLTSNGVNLQNAIELGEFKPDKESVMIVDTYLSKDYSDTLNHDISYVDWAFYAQYEDEEPREIIEVPDTFENKNYTVTFLSIGIILFGLVVMIISLKNKKDSKN
ncbi:MAG: hypothetical protein IJ568_06465 [Bacilli bacterium]|nr:hypothetical protein [Bacilli bacterium]